MSAEAVAVIIITCAWDLWREKKNANLLRDTIADFHAENEEEWAEVINSMSDEELYEYAETDALPDYVAEEIIRIKNHDFPPCKNCGNEGNVIFNYDLIYLCLDCDHVFDEDMDPEPREW